MDWIWRGDYLPADAQAIRTISRQLESEKVLVQTQDGEQESVLYSDLKIDKKAAILKSRVKDYSRRIHKRHKDTVEEIREDVVCQRENGFYVETVRNFRDRRYVYKAKTKQAFKHLMQLKNGEVTNPWKAMLDLNIVR